MPFFSKFSMYYNKPYKLSDESWNYLKKTSNGIENSSSQKMEVNFCLQSD